MRHVIRKLRADPDEVALKARRGLWSWLHRPPRGTVSAWDVQWSILIWGLAATGSIVAVGVLFERDTITALVFVLSLIGAGCGCWLRTARHWHPIEEFKNERRDS